MSGTGAGARLRIGVDVGGTFTDFVLLDDEGRTFIWKEDSTPHDPAEAIIAGLDGLAAQVDLSVGEMLGATAVFVHGSTIATNAVIERTGSKVGLLCTQGFRDVLYLRDGFKWDRFNVTMPRPEDFVPRNLRLQANERITSDGTVRIPLDEESVKRAAREFEAEGVEAIAIAFLWSVSNPGHEHRAAEIIGSETPGTPVVCSADVLPEIGEWQRASAAVLSAYSFPKIRAYLGRLEQALADRGLRTPMQVMQINGGCASTEEILKRPVNAIHSGPAAAPSAALHYASRIGSTDLINVDMGGTSFDVSLIRQGSPVMSREIEVEHQPVGVSGVEVHSIGAGGGSIAWIDSGGALRLGPHSAGARPGPVAYAQGGTEPTVTDANIVLGYLAPENFLGGRRTLRADLAEEAIAARVGEPLSLSPQAAAAGIFRLANANMADGIRYISVERGIDPRGFTLVSGGGAGSIHATAVARSLGIRTVVIPAEAAVFCAFGMTVTDVRHDYTRAARSVSDDPRTETIRKRILEMESQARERLSAEGFTEAEVKTRRYADARYLNQVHELTIPIPDGQVDDAYLENVDATFHREHRDQFTYEISDAPVEYLHWRVTATGEAGITAQSRELPSRSHPKDAEPVSHRLAYVDGEDEPASTPVYDRAELESGASVFGPAIVFSPVTTIVLGRDDELKVHHSGALHIAVSIPG